MPYDPPKFWTYQDLMKIFNVSYRTVLRWFSGRKLLRPSPGTVRISQEDLEYFIRKSGKRRKP